MLCERPPNTYWTDLVDRQEYRASTIRRDRQPVPKLFLKYLWLGISYIKHIIIVICVAFYLRPISLKHARICLHSKTFT